MLKSHILKEHVKESKYTDMRLAPKVLKKRIEHEVSTILLMCMERQREDNYGKKKDSKPLGRKKARFLRCRGFKGR